MCIRDRLNSGALAVKLPALDAERAVVQHSHFPGHFVGQLRELAVASSEAATAASVLRSLCVGPEVREGDGEGIVHGARLGCANNGALRGHCGEASGQHSSGYNDLVHCHFLEELHTVSKVNAKARQGVMRSDIDGSIDRCSRAHDDESERGKRHSFQPNCTLQSLVTTTIVRSCLEGPCVVPQTVALADAGEPHGQNSAHGHGLAPRSNRSHFIATNVQKKKLTFLL